MLTLFDFDLLQDTQINGKARRMNAVVIMLQILDSYVTL